MRCRECGLELDARDRLRNGAYQCPECGAITHTASSSRVSPSPWRRKRRSGLGAVADVFTQRRFGLPLWGWIVVVLAVIVALILLLGRGKGTVDEVATPDVSSAPVVEASESPEMSPEPTAAPEPTQIVTNASTLSTEVRPNDFTVGFDWAMSKLKYSENLTQQDSGVSTTGDTVDVYTFQDWYSLQLVIAPETNMIRSAVATVQLEAGAENDLKPLSALAATVYALDNTITANGARKQLQAMVADNSKYYDRPNFSAQLASTDAEYTLTISGTK